MENNELISVIVPVYNVSNYLKKCINSILSQTYKNFEIIIVDDGSTDGSETICDEYKNNPNIQIIHKKNGGLSSARNEGLKRSKGKYICFIDSDDYIEGKYLEVLYEMIIRNESDVAVCGFDNVDEKGNVLSNYKYNKKAYIYTPEKALLKMMNLNIPFTQCAWNKLYKKSIFCDNDLKYPEGFIYEDLATTPVAIGESNRISFVNEPLYHYVKREGSIVQSESFKQKEYDRIKMAEICYNYVANKFKNIEKEYYAFLIHQNISVYNLSLKSDKKMESEILLNKIKKMIKGKYLKIITSKINLRRKLQITLLYISSRLYKKLYLKRK